MTKIITIFTVTDRDGKEKEEVVDGYGQEPVKIMMKKYPRFTKFVLEGFEIEGNFIEVDLRTYNRA